VRLGEDVLEQANLVEQVRSARLQHFTPEFPIERLVSLEDDHVGAAFSQQQAEQQACRASTHDASADANTGHGSTPAGAVCGTQPLAMQSDA
jgi:hypothetical protein